MDDGLEKIKAIPDDFQASTSSVESLESRTPSISEPRTDKSLRYCFLTDHEGRKQNQKVIKRLLVILKPVTQSSLV